MSTYSTRSIIASQRFFQTVEVTLCEQFQVIFDNVQCSFPDDIRDVWHQADLNGETFCTVT